MLAWSQSSSSGALPWLVVDGKRRRIARNEKLPEQLLHQRPYSAKIAQMKDADARALLRDLFDAALAAARPATCLAPVHRQAAAAEGQDRS